MSVGFIKFTSPVPIQGPALSYWLNPNLISEIVELSPKQAKTYSHIYKIPSEQLADTCIIMYMAADLEGYSVTSYLIAESAESVVEKVLRWNFLQILLQSENDPIIGANKDLMRLAGINPYRVSGDELFNLTSDSTRTRVGNWNAAAQKEATQEIVRGGDEDATE